MKTCPGCSRAVADVIGQCPFCRQVFAGPVNDKPMLDPELISAAIAAEREEANLGRSALFQALLLLLALPVIVPSLVWYWIGAKRWGRIDGVLLAVSGGVFTLLALGSPYALALMLIADAAAAALFVMRYGRLDDGIFLGYSNAVALPLILAGILAAIGVFACMPVTAIAQLSRLYSPENAVTVQQLASGRAPGAPCPVRLEGATLAATGRLAQARDEKGSVRLVRAAALEPIVVARPKELWERRDKLVGSIVHLTAPAAVETFVRTGVKMQREVGGPKETDANTRVYALMPEAQDRVWIASDPPLSAPIGKPSRVPVSDGPEAAARQLATPGERFGALVVTYGDAELARAWSQRRPGKPLPDMAVAVVPGVGATAAADPTAPTYVPIEGTDEQLWVFYPAGAPIGPTGSISGIFEMSSERIHHRLVSVMTRDDFARASGLRAQVTGGTLGAGLVFLGLAALLVLAGLVAALRE